MHIVDFGIFYTPREDQSSSPKHTYNNAHCECTLALQKKGWCDCPTTDKSLPMIVADDDDDDDDDDMKIKMKIMMMMMIIIMMI